MGGGVEDLEQHVAVEPPRPKVEEPKKESFDYNGLIVAIAAVVTAIGGLLGVYFKYRRGGSHVEKNKKVVEE